MRRTLCRSREGLPEGYYARLHPPFKGALCIFLPFYILEVQKLLCFVLRLPEIGRGIDRRLAGQVRGQLPDVLYAVDGQTATSIASRALSSGTYSSS